MSGGVDPSAVPTGGQADVIVVAAGASRRMLGIDKLLAPLGGRPLLAVTLEAITATPVVGAVIVVTATERQPDVAASTWLPAAVRAVVAGGERRQDSVRAGFEALERLVPDPGWPARGPGP